MKYVKTVILLATAVLGADGLCAATDKANGTLLSSEPCPQRAPISFDAYREEIKGRLENERAAAAKEGFDVPKIKQEDLDIIVGSPENYAARLAYSGFECRQITYASGGLKIAGFLYKPSTTSGKKLPLVIAVRGGNADFGAFQPWTQDGFYDYVNSGFVVLASQYRGGPGSEGEDGYGGADLEDVRALLPLAESLGYVDMRNIFLFGGSRGGMQSFMLMRAGLPVRAAAIRAGAADLNLENLDRPGLMEVFRKRIVGFDDDPHGKMRDRSAVLWANEIDTPMILFHGSADWRVPVTDVLGVASRLAKAKKDFELHIYWNDDHAISMNRLDMHNRAINFFNRHRVTP